MAEPTPSPISERPVLAPGLIAAALLVIAVAPLEYGYYIFLRLAVTAAAIWIAVVAFRVSQTGWGIAAVLLALLFNPLIPVWLSRGVWIPLDLLGAAVLAAAAFAVKGKPPSR